MRKTILSCLLFSVLLSLSAVQYKPVGELFTANWCPYCPTTQAAWVNYFISADNDFIPIMWKQETSPGFAGRFIDLYIMGALPTMIFGGDYHFETGDTLEEIYVMLKSRNSPMLMDGLLEDLGNNQIKATMRVNLVNNLITQDNKIVFFLTNHDGDPLTHSIEIDKSEDIPFDLTLAGEVMVFEHIFDLENLWVLENMRVVVLVQSWESKTILQAAELKILDSIEVDFTTETAFGPPSLEVRFQNTSEPVLNLDLIEWDFDGDGVFDSNEDHPVHYYDGPGSYDVRLRITKDGVTEEITKDDYITVSETNNISGNVGGIWTAANSPYEISDTITIPPDFTLQIEAGTELLFSEGTCLNVDGILQSVGTAEEQIIFSSDTEWNGIKIVDSFNDNVIDYSVISKSSDGGLYIENSKAIITNNQIIENTASGNAPAIQLVNCTEVQILRNFISRNQSTSYVGGLGFTASDATVMNNLIVNNEGNLASALALEEDSVVEMINNTISHNEGGAAAFVHTSDLIATNNVIWQDTNLFIQIGSVPEVEYCCLSENFNGTGNIFSDPEFSNPPEGWGMDYFSQIEDWIYLPSSPCIDAGNPDAAFNDFEDPNNPGNPLYPAQGSLTNDIGIFGGIGFDHEINVVQVNDDLPTQKLHLTNYPNPFNPSTTISFSFPSDINEGTELGIYNLKGQKIKTFSNLQITQLPNHQIVWNGTDDNKKPVASGVYFCRLKVGKTEITKKLMLIK